jgi:N-acetylneuraminate synthase
VERDTVENIQKNRTMISIGNKKIGELEPCFIIAEAGVNHNGNISSARRLIDAASDAGADAVKFQTFKTENLVTPYAEKAEYQEKNDPTEMTQFEMLKKLEFSEAEFKKLSTHAKKKGIVFLSTAFDDESLDLLVRLDVPAFKIPSGEITNFPCMDKIAMQKKPVILSTGMSTMEEVKEAVTYLQEHGCRDIILLHCTTSYPAPLKSVNLRVLDTLRDVFHLPVGYSDHTEGILVPIAAVARGASVVEKHFTLDRTLPGPDHAASIEPDELKTMISVIRKVEQVLGTSDKKPESCEISNRNVVRKSVVASENIPKGSLLSESMLTLKRPGTGIEPKYLQDLVGKRVKKAINKDTLISRDMIE